VTRTRQHLGKAAQRVSFRAFVSDSCNSFESALEVTCFGLSWSNPGKSVVHCLA
jgi:hypothetical protein